MGILHIGTLFHYHCGELSDCCTLYESLIVMSICWLKVIQYVCNLSFSGLVCLDVCVLWGGGLHVHVCVCITEPFSFLLSDFCSSFTCVVSRVVVQLFCL